jgi:hypothetical protein
MLVFRSTMWLAVYSSQMKYKRSHSTVAQLTLNSFTYNYNSVIQNPTGTQYYITIQSSTYQTSAHKYQHALLNYLDNTFGQ